MPNKGKGISSERESEDSGEVTGYQDSAFILLDDLVYAPLHALAKSNQQLREHVLEAIRSMGTSKQDGQEEIIHLNNINIAYEQIHSEEEDGYSVDNLQMQAPLMSIVPVTNLNVDKAEINFATEIQVVNENNGGYKINGRICSPEQRDSDFLPKVNYKLKVNSIPATEGLLRLTDVLNASQVMKKLDTTPIAADGNLETEEQKDMKQSVTDRQTKIRKLKQLYQKISDMLDEQEKLHQLSKDVEQEDAYMLDEEKYRKAQSDIANKIMEYQEQIMDLEIDFGLDKNDETE